jgi:hypothetical protein
LFELRQLVEGVALPRAPQRKQGGCQNMVSATSEITAGAIMISDQKQRASEFLGAGLHWAALRSNLTKTQSW